ncbi:MULTISPECIES: hypothetical protein [Allobranchiibius]|uniref:Protein-tyrosine phosphatase n=1 Tax=Allobranchiibius huperziae TaxID=1874116 RepID=A0A853DHP6_9MICO|nr:hypothetical protein [Allobranchiibius sp. GilTou38]NYJ75543.1 protein-tyrosine phosphatase [Allobranchiibius huperziae]
MASDCFKVLVVCTANICRSPATALLLRSSLQDALAISVVSAGTRALKGSEMVAAMQQKLPADLSDGAATFRSTRLTAAMLLEADLILVMTRVHRSEVVSMCPSVVRKVFTVPEFARLLDDALTYRSSCRSNSCGATPSDALRQLREDASRARGAVRAPGRDDDIQDPARMSRRECRKVLERIARSVEPIARAFEQVTERHDREPLLVSSTDVSCVECSPIYNGV